MVQHETMKDALKMNDIRRGCISAAAMAQAGSIAQQKKACQLSYGR